MRRHRRPQLIVLMGWVSAAGHHAFGSLVVACANLVYAMCMNEPLTPDLLVIDMAN
jgi:hypothetical protein